MTKNIHTRHLLELNFAMLLISTSGALGRYIDLPVPATIAIRAFFALVFVFAYCQWKKINLRIRKEDRVFIFGSGLFMGLHWVTYFYALQLSNVAIGMLSLFTYPVLTSFLEPLLLRTKFQRIHLLLGLLVLFGIYFLAPEFSLKSSYTLAVILGVFSALCYALRNLILKKRVQNYHGTALMNHQLIIIFIFLAPFLFYADPIPIREQWQPLLILALCTTAIGHTLFLNSFKHFSITTASILSSVQPVYGILIGMFFLREMPSLNTVFGGILILSSVCIESIRSYR